MFKRLKFYPPALLAAVLVFVASPLWAEEKLPPPYQKIGEMYVAVWEPPAGAEKLPLLFFSHGSVEGCATQSSFLTQALAEAGYIVMAPNHGDAMCDSPPKSDPQKGRGKDFWELLTALRADPLWVEKIDFTRIGFLGFSRGGAVGLGLAGASSPGIPAIRAVLAMAPTVETFLANDGLKNIRVPVMYQVGTEDREVTPDVVRENGAFAHTPAPAWLVENSGAAHFGWTDREPWQPELIVHYARAFFDATLNGAPPEALSQKIRGVGRLEVK